MYGAIQVGKAFWDTLWTVGRSTTYKEADPIPSIFYICYCRSAPSGTVPGLSNEPSGRVL